MNQSSLFGFARSQLTPAGRPVYSSNEIEQMIVSGISVADPISGKEVKDFYNIYLTTHRIYLVNHEVSASSIDYCLSCAISTIEKTEKEGGGFFKSPKVKLSIRELTINEVSITFKKGKRDEFLDTLQDQIKRKKWTEDVKLNTSASTSSLSSPVGSSSLTGTVSTPNLESQNDLATKKPRDFTTSKAGVGGIMKRIEEENKKEREELDDAFSDLNSLMEKAKDMVELAESFKNKVVERMKNNANNTQEEKEEEDQMYDFLLNLGLTSPVTKQSSGAHYHQQLSRQLVDFLDKIVQEKYGGVITLTDAYCLYNRARGTDLISPEDMQTACSLFEKLRLPMRLITFASGVVVIQSSQYSDKLMAEKIERFIKDGTEIDSVDYKFITAVRLAQLMNVSVILAKELLLSAEQSQALCRDENEEGVRYYLVSEVFDAFQF